MVEGVQAELAEVEEELQAVEADIEHLLARQQHLSDQRERLQQRLAAEARAPNADWTGAFEWDGRVEAALQNVFGLDGFRPLQREVINATLQGRDCLCLLPAGGGKSLIYQLPAVMEGAHGITLVVSPLLSLIQDQVHHLGLLNIDATSLTSVTSKEETSAINERIDSPQSGLRLLYCTPEKIVNSKRFLARLEKLYKAGCLARIAIDEAHCCSAWGNDFRTDYKKLGILRQQFPNTPIIALTATATQAVCNEVCAILRIEGCEVFRSHTNRPNLLYEVLPKPASAEGVMDDMAGWIKAQYPNRESGIVYCLTRKDTETVAAELGARGLAALAYHADMEPAARQRVHQMWTEGSTQIICATIAFGMGISKADVRFVIHHSMSKSIENYYQESGRAGRDGKPAVCRCYFRLGDYLRQASVVVMESGWERHLGGMLGYVSSTSCRRSVIARHFGEAPPACHAMCDVCKAAATGSAAAQRDVTAAALGALSTLANWPAAQPEDKRATLNQLLDKWRASKEAGAAAKAMSKDDNELVVRQLLLDGCLQLDFGFTAYATNCYLKQGSRAAAVLQGKRRVVLTLPPAPPEEGAGPSGAKSSAGGWLRQQRQQRGDGGAGPSRQQQQQQQQAKQQQQQQQAKQQQQQQQAKQQQQQAQQVVDLVSDSDSDFEDPTQRQGLAGKRRRAA